MRKLVQKVSDVLVLAIALLTLIICESAGMGWGDEDDE